MGTLLSPEQAAQRAGVSRRTILRAVKARELGEVWDNQNRRRIDSDRLDAWAASRSPSRAGAGRARSDPGGGPQLAAELRAVEAERNQLRERLAGREAELAGLRALLEATETDRDHWRELARQPWWERWFGIRR